MNERSSALTLRAREPRLGTGLLVAITAIVLTTVLVYPLRKVVPDAATGIVYLMPVLLISIYWGMGLGLVTAVASAAAYNYFHIHPTGQFTIARSENWVSLGVLLAVAVVASALGALARSRAAEAEERRREADLAAQLASSLLGGVEVGGALADASGRIAEALDVDTVRIELREATARTQDEQAYQLNLGGERHATLIVTDSALDTPSRRVVAKVLPALEALLSAALDREALQLEVVETQALRQSDELKTALLRSVSHDLRTPLTAIVMSSEALNSPHLSETERAELAGAITEGAQRMAGLVDKLLDLSRLEAGAAEPHVDWCSIEEVMVAAVAEVAPDGAPEIQLTIDPQLPLVRADGAQLERAFANLLENAARHSAGHPVLVRSRVVGTRIVIRVVDRGPGIAEKELDRIFEPFYRGEGSDRHTGSGLGLAIVRGFIEANGGRVWAESLPGQGTVFVIEFPLTEQQVAERESTEGVT